MGSHISLEIKFDNCRAMAPEKFVIKCGNFAVLVDLHVLSPGSQEDASWFTAGHIKEVTSLVRDAVDQRVKQYKEFLHNRQQPKQKKELGPASTFFVKGESFNLVANFLKRHSNLRCVVKQDLRLFPERYLVCVSRPVDASAHHRNPSPVASLQQLVTVLSQAPSLPTSSTLWANEQAELNEQSRSEYFSSVGETQELLNSPTKTKKSVLQKIAKHASAHQELCGSTTRKLQIKAGESKSSSKTVPRSALKKLAANHNVPCKSSSTEPEAQKQTSQKQKQEADNSWSDSININRVSSHFCQHEMGCETSKRCKPSDSEEDPQPQQAKRTCLERPQATMQAHSTESSSQTSKHDHLPQPPSPLVKAKAQSKAFPVSECKKATLEVELLTPGKRAQKLPLTSNNTAQRNQNTLATSLRGLSVKPASSNSSIGSRSTLAEEASENVPRTSRLRRLERSRKGETNCSKDL